MFSSWHDSTMVNIGFVFSTSNIKVFHLVKEIRVEIGCTMGEGGKATWWAGDWWCYSCYVCTHITFNMHVLDADALPAKLKLKIIQILPLTMRRIREKFSSPLDFERIGWKVEGWSGDMMFGDCLRVNIWESVFATWDLTVGQHVIRDWLVFQIWASKLSHHD